MRVRKRILFMFFITSFFLLANRSDHVLATDSTSCTTDTTPPVISNANDFTVEVGAAAPDYLDGITISDNCGDYKVVVQSDYVDLNKLGDYPLYYFVTDPNFNSTQEVVTVHVKYDITAPVFAGIEDLDFKVHDVLNDDLFLNHVSANDNRDGDVTDQITVDYSDVSESEVGTYDVIYTITDSSGNTKKKTITVTIYDDEAPVITLPDPSPVLEVHDAEPDWLSYLTVTDNYDLNPDTIVVENTVDLSTLGTYSVTFKATDSEGNEATATMTVEVVDTTEPVITVPDQRYEVYSDVPIWLDLITVVDNYDDDDDVTIEINTDDVDFDTVGDYTVTVTATDGSGNEATASFTVSIEDTTDPVIIVEDQTYEVHDAAPTWLDLITVTDNYDTDVTIDIDVSDVILDEVGIYTVTVTATDDFQNVTTSTFTVTVVDTTAPVIEVTDQIIDVFSDVPNLLDFVTVTDNYDANITINIEATTLDMDVLGTYTITVTATDDYGNETVDTYTITIVDRVKPEFNVIDPFEYKIGDPEFDYLEDVIVTDNYDGVIPNGNVTVYTEHVDLTKDGYYPVTFEVMDSSGNYNTYTTYVKVYDEVAPEIDGPQDITLAIGYSIDYLAGVTATDNIQGELTDKIVIDDSLVDYTTPGVYKVNYIVTDLSGNVTIVPINVTIFEDTTAPVISGTQDYTVEVYDDAPDYLEGVTVSDNFDPNVTVTVDSSAVDLNTVGTYDVMYTSTDGVGNTETVTITVTVQDTTNPEIHGLDVDDMYEWIEVFSDTPDYLEGITGSDNYDTDVTVVVDSTDVDLETLGEYEVIYTVTDAAGNSVSKTVHYKVVDTTAPQITGPDKRTIEYGHLDGDTLDTIKDIVISDNYDSKSDLLIIASGDYDVFEPGSYEIVVTVKDKSDNEATLTYTLIVEEKVDDDDSTELLPIFIYGGIGLVAVVGIGVGLSRINKKRRAKELE